MRAGVVVVMRIGSLFSGIGGLDLACERVFGGSTLWQVEIDPYCREVLAARWPDAQRFDDVRAVSAANLAPVDVLCGGFPCQDLSVAGKRAGLDGERSGLYVEMLRLASELSPAYVVIENVPKLLHYRQRLSCDFAAIGYGLIWQVCEASDVGAPHKRRRVFVLAVRGAEGSIVLPRPSPQRDLFAPRWQGGDADRLWPTLCSDTRSTRAAMFKQGGEPLGHAVRWPTVTVRGNYNRASYSGRAGDGIETAVRWPTPCAADGAGSRTVPPGTTATGRRPDGSKATIGLQTAVRWPTPCARDHKDSGREPSANNRNSPSLPCIAVSSGEESDPGVLNPAWCALLMGYPAGWTDPAATPGAHAWPLGRGAAQAPHEPPRLIPRASIVKRSARLKALGNAVVPQQAAAALARMVEVATCA